MVVKGRLEPLKTFWEREAASMGGIDETIPEWTGERQCATLLQVASHAGHEGMTEWMLESVHANPTIPIPSGRQLQEGDQDGGHRSDASDTPPALPLGSRRTAYDLAKTRAVRDVFRRCAADHPTWWDWFGAARVPSALSKEMEEEREEKKKVRRKGLKDKVREREAKEREKEKDLSISRPPPPSPEPTKPTQDVTGPRKLGGVTRTDGIAGLTPEMRAKVERERRARAAEMRLKALGGR